MQKQLQDIGKETTRQLAALEGWLEPVFAKAPHLPRNAREVIVNIAPILALVFGVLGIAGIISAGMFAPVFFSFSWMHAGAVQASLAIATIATLIASLLNLLAWQPLGARKKLGWNYLFYGVVLGGVANVLHILFGSATIASLIGTGIGFWVLFEIRDFYKP